MSLATASGTRAKYFALPAEDSPVTHRLLPRAYRRPLRALLARVPGRSSSNGGRVPRNSGVRPLGMEMGGDWRRNLLNCGAPAWGKDGWRWLKDAFSLPISTPIPPVAQSDVSCPGWPSHTRKHSRTPIDGSHNPPAGLFLRQTAPALWSEPPVLLCALVPVLRRQQPTRRHLRLTVPAMDSTPDRGPHIIVALSTLGALSGLFLALRIYCKLSRRRSLWWDDYVLIISWVRELAVDRSLTFDLADNFVWCNRSACSYR